MRKIGRLLVFIIMVSLVAAAGCTALRKPAPRDLPGTQAPSAPSGDPMPTEPGEVSRITSSLSSAASEVKGVNRATVVVAGTTAYVGVDQKAGLEKSETERIKREVSDVVKRTEPRLTAVFVSSDPDLTTRIRRIAGGVKAGRPVSSFDGELKEIARRFSPVLP